MRCGSEVVKRDDAGYDRSECGGNLGIVGVCDVRLIVNDVMAHFGAKRITDLTNSAGELDGGATDSNFDVRKALRSEPLGYCLNVSVDRPKREAELLWREPAMIVT